MTDIQSDNDFGRGMGKGGDKEALRKRAEDLADEIISDLEPLKTGINNPNNFNRLSGRIEKFAAEVAAAERARCAKVCRELAKSVDNEYNKRQFIIEKLQEPYLECAEAIEQLSAQGAPVVPPADSVRSGIEKAAGLLDEIGCAGGINPRSASRDSARAISS